MICECPCKREFLPRRANQKYSTPECRERARRERSPVVRLTARERERIEMARTGHKSVAPHGNHAFPGYGPTRRQQTHQRALGDRLMTSEEVRQFLGVSRWQMREWRTSPDGRGPAFIRIGKRARYLPSDVLSFVRAGRVKRPRKGTP